MRFVADRWKHTVVGSLLAIVGTLAGLLAYVYLGMPRPFTWVLYGLCIGSVFIGLGSVAYSLAMPKVARWLVIVPMSALAGVEAWEALGWRLAQCKASISGISVLEPDLVCRCAFGIVSIGAAYVLACVIVGLTKNGA